MADVKIGVVGLPGKWSTETLANAVAASTGRRLIIDIEQVRADFVAGRLLFRDQDLCQLDALIVKKISDTYSPSTLDYLELLRVAEQAGVRVFSPARSMLRLINRLSCTVTLRNAGIPMPDTCVTGDIDVAQSVLQVYDCAVFKPLYSTKARGMCLIEKGQDSIQAVRAFREQNPVMYIQRKIDLPGQDMGMVFLGGRYLGSYARVSGEDAWNTTINSGGRYAPCQPSQAVIDLATRAQSLFEMDFTTFDVAETEDGPVVFEVSAFGGFRGAAEGIGIDAARLYVDYVLAELAS